jgi:hypothetical protein
MLMTGVFVLLHRLKLLGVEGIAHWLASEKMSVAK